MRIQLLRTFTVTLLMVIVFTLTAVADDTCMFSTTADDVPPMIVLLLDNGAEMEQIYWHPDYDPAVDYTPTTGIAGYPNGVFTNPMGYALQKSGSKYYLYPILSDLTVGSSGIAASVTNDPTWTVSYLQVISGVTTTVYRSVTLPATPSTSVDADGIKDNADQFRYNTNYLNWIFYSGLYSGSGADLPAQSRFYYAKKAIMTVAKLTANKAIFGINNFTANANGASNVQPLGLVVQTPLAANPANNVLEPNFINNVNNMGTVTYSPLAEGLASVGGYFASNSAGVVTVDKYCQRLFALVISPGVSSEDAAIGSSSKPTTLTDDDNDGEGGALTISGTTYTIPLNYNGTTYLDDVANYLYTHDIPEHSKAPGFQRVSTYTLGFMGDDASNTFLINASNNGNGNLNLYDDTDEEYGKYHFRADNPDSLADQLLAAINAIIDHTSTFTAPVVPVTRTTSGDVIYMAFFKPNAGNFWQGSVDKFGLDLDDPAGVVIVDANGNPATWPNGAMRETAVPYWSTKNWADPSQPNYMANGGRTIFSNLVSNNLSAAGNEFSVSNANLTAADLDNPADVIVNGNTVAGRSKVIEYIRGGDVFDEDTDGDTTENRSVISGDILHSEPLVVKYANAYSSDTFIFYGANDGMLHAVNDADGTEQWGYIPAHQLVRLKQIIEGTGHLYFIDASPKVVVIGDDGDESMESGEQVILICGERRGGSSYFALDITNPLAPQLLWKIGQTAGVPELGQSWSEPRFGKVKTSSGDTIGTQAMFIGGGYDASNAHGQAVLVVDVLTGSVLRTFKDGWYASGMTFSISSAVTIVDTNGNGFIDKAYVGDLGGQMWRIGKFTDSTGASLPFPQVNEDMSTWNAEIMFSADPAQKIYYPPAITLEVGFDMLFFGTGDRDQACDTATFDAIYAVKDTHQSFTLLKSDLVDVTDPLAPPPDMATDNGFYLNLAPGEKVLSEGLVFYKTYYITTFTPGNVDPCVPGGTGKLYALNYLTGEAVLDFDGDGTNDRSTLMGGGIPSKPVMVIPDDGEPKLLVSVGSTNPDPGSEETGAGVVLFDPRLPNRNFFYLWWRTLN